MIRYLMRRIARRFPGWIERKSAGNPNAFWTYKDFTGWVKDMSSTQIHSQLKSRRSDGQYFYVAGVIRAEDDISAMRDSHQENMDLSLDEYLHCRCMVNKPCLKHWLRGYVGPFGFFQEFKYLLKSLQR
jgi:hypothetical protein